MNPHPFLELIPLQAATPSAQRARSSLAEAAQAPAAAEGNFLALLESEACASPDGAGARPLAAMTTRGNESLDAERILSSEPALLHAVALGQEGVALPSANISGFDFADGDSARSGARTEEISVAEQQGLVAETVVSDASQIEDAKFFPVDADDPSAPPPLGSADSTALASGTPLAREAMRLTLEPVADGTVTHPVAAGWLAKNNETTSTPGVVALSARALETAWKAQEAFKLGSPTELPLGRLASEGESENTAEAAGQSHSAALGNAFVPTALAEVDEARATGEAASFVAPGPSLAHEASWRTTDANLMASIAQRFAVLSEQTAKPILTAAPQTDLPSIQRANEAIIHAAFAAQGTLPPRRLSPQERPLKA